MSTVPGREHTNTMFCGIPLERLVYAGPQTWTEFDRLALPMKPAGDWVPDRLTGLIEGRGREWEMRCYVKELEDTATGITVIFQWWEKRAIGSEA